MDHPDRIHLRDYIVESDIGAFQHERGLIQRLRFSITVELAEPVIGVEDDVDLILSYDHLTHAVATALAERRYSLLETLAERIAAQVLHHPRAARVEICVEKLDLLPGALGITISRRRGRVAPLLELPPVIVLVMSGPEIPLPDGPLILIPTLDPGQTGLQAMDAAARTMADRLGLAIADSRTELQYMVQQRGKAVVWAPARMAIDQPDMGAGPLELGCWLAAVLGAPRLLLALSPEIPMPTPPQGCLVRLERLPT